MITLEVVAAGDCLEQVRSAFFQTKIQKLRKKILFKKMKIINRLLFQDNIIRNSVALFLNP